MSISTDLMKISLEMQDLVDRTARDTSNLKALAPILDRHAWTGSQVMMSYTLPLANGKSIQYGIVKDASGEYYATVRSRGVREFLVSDGASQKDREGADLYQGFHDAAKAVFSNAVTWAHMIGLPEAEEPKSWMHRMFGGSMSTREAMVERLAMASSFPPFRTGEMVDLGYDPEAVFRNTKGFGFSKDSPVIEGKVVAVHPMGAFTRYGNKFFLPAYEVEYADGVKRWYSTDWWLPNDRKPREDIEWVLASVTAMLKKAGLSNAFKRTTGPIRYERTLRAKDALPLDDVYKALDHLEGRPGKYTIDVPTDVGTFDTYKVDVQGDGRGGVYQIVITKGR